ncbi:MAG: 50S ribosomal protein L25/general stress protein Ctc [Bacteroidales bacterium]|nr:50S ribosomal protein L25/general stress protein Ctc [Bacteroidales bacterium]MCF8455813.1 50S ribosomal protein L25/general stress protein Ctc [Bacteroidales bacterium]
MKALSISGKKRENVGKVNTKMLRKEGHIPCELYGGKENIHFSAPINDFRHLIYTPHVFLVDLDIDGDSHRAIVKEIQFHPVSDKVLHIDFMEIFAGTPVIISIPIKVEGLSEGVKQGGKLTLEHRRLKVKALPKDLPDELLVNVTKLTLGKTIKVGNLKFENIELLDPKNSVVVSVKVTRAAKSISGDGEGEEGDGEAGGAAEGAEETNE